MSKRDSALKAVLVLVVISLVLNYYQLKRIDILESKINNLIFTQHSLKEMERNTKKIYDMLAEAREGEKWITDPSLKPVISENDSKILISWQMKKYNVDSEVTFYYRKEGDKNFTPVEPASLGGGSFQAVIPLEISSMGPVWLITTKDLNDKKSSKIAEKQISAKETNCQYEYYIAVREGDTVRTTRPEKSNLSKLRQHIYNDLNVHVNKTGFNRFSVTLFERDNVDPLHKLKKAYLQVYRDSELIKEIIFTPYKNNKEIYSAVWEQPSEGSYSLGVKVFYDDGSTYQKKIL